METINEFPALEAQAIFGQYELDYLFSTFKATDAHKMQHLLRL